MLNLIRDLFVQNSWIIFFLYVGLYVAYEYRIKAGKLYLRIELMPKTTLELKEIGSIW